MRKNTNKLIFKILLMIFLALMFAAPVSALRGAENGLMLWFNTILPTLLPFIIISNIIIFLDITDYICFLFRPILKVCFRVSNNGCYPIIMGLLSGFPIGAKSAADLVKINKITKDEGQFLISLCNNASITFITSYIAISCLNLPNHQFIVLGIIYLSAILSAIIGRAMNRGNKVNKCITITPETAQIHSGKRKGSVFELIDSAILDGFEVITKVGGYIILFSIAAQLIIDYLPNFMIAKLSLVGFLEITTGIHMVSNTGFNQGMKLIMITTMTAFGGLSSLAQTKSVIGDSGLSIIKYVKTRALNAAIAFILSVIYVNLFMA